MNSNVARAVAGHIRADMRDAVNVLCRLAAAFHAAGRIEERDCSINAAAELAADLFRAAPSRFGEAGVH
jgi:hypothetical protein